MFQTRNAAPGVRVLCVKTDNFKNNIVDISMAVPLDESAAANALLIRLLSRTSRDYPDFTRLNAKLDELYGATIDFDVGKSGDAQVLSLYINCLDDRFSLSGDTITDKCIELLMSMLFNPDVKNRSFGADKLATEKRLLINEILDEKDDKRAYALKKCISYMCENEPFGRDERGTQEEISSVKMADVYAAWKNILKTAVFQVTVVGGTDIDGITDILSSQFSKIERDPCQINTVFKKKATGFKRYEESEPVNQGKLVMGYRSGMESADDGYYKTMVMTDIFGGGTYSKLFANVREKMSLAYYCSASLYKSKGLIIVQSGIDTDKEKTASAAIINQLNDVRDGNFDDEVLMASKRSIRERLTFSNPNSFCSWYENFILTDKILSPEQVIAEVEKVTRKDVMEAAKRVSLDKIFMLSASAEEEEPGEN